VLILVIYLLKSYTSIVVNIKCFEHRQCEISQQFKMSFTQSLRSVLLNIAISMRQKCDGDYLSDILQIVKSCCDNAYALAISLFILLTFVWSKSRCNNSTHSLRAYTTHSNATYNSVNNTA